MNKIKKTKLDLISTNFYKNEKEPYYLYKHKNILYVDFTNTFSAMDYKELLVNGYPKTTLKELYENLNNKKYEIKDTFYLDYETFLTVDNECDKQKLEVNYFPFDSGLLTIKRNVNWNMICKLFRGLSKEERIEFYHKENATLLTIKTKYYTIFYHLNKEDFE